MRQTMMMARAGARRALLAAGLALGVAAAGCGSKDATGPSTQDLPGSYTLTAVDGARVPATVFQGPYGGAPNVKLVVLSSSMVLDPSGRYAISMQLKAVAPNGQEVPLSVSDTGFYQRNGSALNFTSDQDWIDDYPGDITDQGVEVGIDLTGTGDPPAYLFRRS